MAVNIKKKISFEELASNLLSVFTSIIREQETIAVEADNGKQVVLSPFVDEKPEVSLSDHRAFLSSAGSWSDINTDSLLDDIYHSRSISTRAVVEL